MKLQDLLQNESIDLAKTKLVRHNMSREDVALCYNAGTEYFHAYQSTQRKDRFKGSEYIIGFLGTEGTNGVFLGCYKITDCVPFEKSRLPAGHPELDYDDSVPRVFYKMIKTDMLSDLVNRLVIDWGKAARSWYQNGTTEKEIICILPVVSDITFASYDKVMLMYDKLKMIVDNNQEHNEWVSRLSSVAGIYLITDTKTGKHYVGSASGEMGGIWGRWSQYVKTMHGGNKKLVELMNSNADYCKNFLFSILEVFPIKRDRRDILEYEALYKKKLCTIQFGLNDN